MIPNITPLSPGPNRATMDSDEYSAAADVTMSELPVMVEEQNDAIDAINLVAGQIEADADSAAASAASAAASAAAALSATDYVTTSSSSLSLTAGTKNVELDEASAFVVGDLVGLKRRGDAAAVLAGEVQPGSTATDLILDVPAEGVLGTGGPFTDWFVYLVAIQTPAATKADFLAGETAEAALTPAVVSEAIEWAVLADGAMVTPDGLLGRNFTWTIGGNRSLEAVENCKVNQVYHLWITQDGTGGHDLVWDDTVYQRTGGLPVLPQDPGDEAHLQLKILAVDGLGVATQVLATYSSAPTGV